MQFAFQLHQPYHGEGNFNQSRRYGKIAQKDGHFQRTQQQRRLRQLLDADNDRPAWWSPSFFSSASFEFSWACADSHSPSQIMKFCIYLLNQLPHFRQFISQNRLFHRSVLHRRNTGNCWQLFEERLNSTHASPDCDQRVFIASFSATTAKPSGSNLKRLASCSDFESTPSTNAATTNSHVSCDWFKRPTEAQSKHALMSTAYR